MNFWRLISRSMVYHRRGHLGLFLGVSITCAVLTGAFLTGNSIRHSLRRIADERLERIEVAMNSGDRFIREKLTAPMAKELNALVAAGIRLQGVVTNPERSRQVSVVEVLGVNSSFWQMGNSPVSFESNHADQAIINKKLAERLHVSVGDTVVVRVEKPSTLPKDAVLVSTKDNISAIRSKVIKIATAEEFGNFSLSTNQVAPHNLFLPLETLQNLVDRPDKVNLLLVGSGSGNSPSIPQANEVFRKHWSLADIEAKIRELPDGTMTELRSERIFLDPPLVETVLALFPNTQKILTYFVNELRVGERSTPYSMVAAISRKGHSHAAQSTSLFPKDMKEDEILVNSWCAQDLQASPGNNVILNYYVIDQNGRLCTRETSFTIRDILPTEGSEIDRSLTPNIPGLSNSENCREWDTGIPVDFAKIRQKDEEYWDLYRATPKAVITFTAGEKIWKNRFGNTTALRFPKQAEAYIQLNRELPRSLDPKSFGLFFMPVREAAEQAVNQSTDFSILFMSFSFFLIVASLLLSALLFVFSVDQRAEEQGTLLALGFTTNWIQRFYLGEGLLIVLPAACLGAILGTIYTRTMLLGLSTLWNDAVGNWQLTFQGDIPSMVLGGSLSVVITLITLYLCLRKLKDESLGLRFFRPADGDSKPNDRNLRLSLWGGAISLGIAFSIVGFIALPYGRNDTLGFFSTGMMVLIAGLAFSSYYLHILARESRDRMPGLLKLGIRNLSRRRRRSLAIIGILASALFIIISLESQRLNTPGVENTRASGTGGFAFIGETTQPVYDDLNSKNGREQLGLDLPMFSEIEVVPMRILAGDDASCLNLNRAQRPRLVGVDPDLLARRNAFSFSAYDKGSDISNPWRLLESELGSNIIPAIADIATIKYALGKTIGDSLTYIDEHGKSVDLLFVGALSNSVLQGVLIVDEKALIRHFPSVSGFRMFLVDAPAENLENIRENLDQSLQDLGLELATTAERLAEFSKVQNTYISIFQALGGLGMVLGSIGLGALVLRNVLERRSELAVMSAIGFTKKSIQRMLMGEHVFLLSLGMVCGTCAAMIAIFPKLSSVGLDVPLLSLAVMLGCILLNGLLWTWLAVKFTIRHSFLPALRKE